ncbi:alpha/beta fold hydrolase [Marinobacter sp. UBA2498]|uniref:alpha/beta fold hydrolase n=1 Tax=Marinobacter sp. UBA2498 TaxID=1946813 RepID=UPI00257C1102|nr:alpha/beta fold hydrolase [Marinobacter sp. UBA2498]
MDGTVAQAPRVRRFPLPSRGGEMAALEFGPPDRDFDLVFCHANGFNAATYRSILTPLGAQMRILAIDLRGHGATDLPTELENRRGWGAYRDDLLALLPHVVRGPVTVAGHSMGATTSLMAAAQAPDLISNLVLFDPVLMPERGDVAPGDIAQSPMVQGALRRRARFDSRAAAVAAYQNQPPPPLLVVECGESAERLLAHLDQLAEVCDPGSKVVVIGAANDIALYRELMRRGVSEYLVPPFKPLQFVRSLCGLYADPSAPFVGRQIAFCGAKGGVGVSTIAHNVAYAITERLAANAVLVDLDLPFGTAGLDFNQDPLQGVADALGEPDRLDPVLMDRMMARCSDRLSLFAAPATLDQDYDISPEAFEEVTQKIRGAAPFVVLDLPHVWTAWKRRILLSSDDLVIVAEPDLASLRNAKNLVDLVRRARPNDAPPRLVLNQVGVPGRPEIPVKDFGEALNLTPALVLPFEPKLFGQAANNGQMLAEVAPRSKTAEALNDLAQQISRREPPVAQKSSLLANLFRRK